MAAVKNDGWQIRPSLLAIIVGPCVLHLTQADLYRCIMAIKRVLCHSTAYWHNKNCLCCRWQTRATQCLMPTVLYTDLDGQCDKLVTDDRHQFITLTLTVHLSRQHQRRSPWHSTCSHSGWCPPKFKWFTWPNHAPFGVVWCSYGHSRSLEIASFDRVHTSSYY